MNGFRKDRLFFVVPLKCGYTAFSNAARRGVVSAARITPGQQVYGVVRNPENRLLSFFNDKLRDNIDPKRVQHCQRFVLNGFGLTDVRDLAGISFDEFVALLKNTEKQKWDCHLLPFSTAYFARVELIGLIHLDSAASSGWLFDFLKINPANKQAYNKSRQDASLTVSRETLEAIRALFEEDYKLLREWQYKGEPLSRA